jgi:hypothetical protein
VSVRELRRALTAAGPAQLEAVDAWHRGTPAAFGDGLYDLVLAQHHVNLGQWHAEDAARARGASDSRVAAAKRAIDRSNAERHRLIQAVDERALTLLAVDGVGIEADARLASESPGAILDRCSIGAIRIWHREHAGRASCAPPLGDGSAAQLAAISAQRSELLRCLIELVDDVVAGRRRFAAHQPFKSYRDDGAPLSRQELP